MTVFEIPLASVPQQLRITLNAVDYLLTVSWCKPAACWMMDLALASTGQTLLAGNPLVTGADLLGQYAYLGIGGSLVVQTDHNTLTPPTFDNLGLTAHLFFIPYA